MTTKTITHRIDARNKRGNLVRIPSGVEVVVEKLGREEVAVMYRGKLLTITRKDYDSQGPGDLYRMLNAPFGGR